MQGIGIDLEKKGCHYHDRLEKETKDNIYIHISWAEFRCKILPWQIYLLFTILDAISHFIVKPPLGNFCYDKKTRGIFICTLIKFNYKCKILHSSFLLFYLFIF